MNKKKKIIIAAVLLAVILIGLAAFFLNPYSKVYAGNCLKGTMSVTVNDETVIPQNVTCTYGNGETVDLQTVSTEDGLRLKARAFPYDGYTVSYDVETEEGIKHFTFMVMKTHNGGPVRQFAYQMDLEQKEGEWVAEVLLVEPRAEGKVQIIPLSEDETAYVQLGP